MVSMEGPRDGQAHGRTAPAAAEAAERLHAGPDVRRAVHDDGALEGAIVHARLESHQAVRTRRERVGSGVAQAMTAQR
jgi:hypothetical protein